MIHHLRGKLIHAHPAHAIVECSGVGYLAHITLQTFARLPQPGAEVTLLVHPIYREDFQGLYGFYTSTERDVFRLLLSVSGIGAATAQLILSSLTPEEVIAGISSGNSGLFQAVKGVGAKTAQRLIVDLRDKAGRIQPAGTTVAGPTGLSADALLALDALGFSRNQTERVVAKILSDSGPSSVEDIVRQALKNL
jgi:Holliday junction DNA helicase RuvA